jgi:hypothetical protein
VRGYMNNSNIQDNDRCLRRLPQRKSI